MGWAEQMDGYCERVDFTYWSEPLNAITNLSFIIAAAIMWRRAGSDGAARLLCAILFAIGTGSFLFHTHATFWAMLTDVIPIGIFILVYLFLVNRDVAGMSGWRPYAATALFFPYAALMLPALNALPFFHISNFYWTVPILLFAYSFVFRTTYPETTRGMTIGAGLLCVSISLRSVDEMLCHVFPIGTHIFWHILNGIMLGWMIEVYRRHREGSGRAV